MKKKKKWKFGEKQLTELLSGEVQPSITGRINKILTRGITTEVQLAKVQPEKESQAMLQQNYNLQKGQTAKE